MSDNTAIASERRTRYVIGCMSGTSLDGLDCVLTKITGTGLQMEAGFVRSTSAHFSKTVASALSALCSGKPVSAQITAMGIRGLSMLHAETVQALMDEAPNTAVDFVSAHGQTVYHNGEASLSLQLLDPWPIVRACGVPVCYDLRHADLAAGGHGAPLSPIADPILYHDLERAAVINLGGVCNITHFEKKGSDPFFPDDVRGFDAAPCNLLLDGLCQRLLNQPYDIDGSIAAATAPDARLVDKIHQRIEMASQTMSMGREQFGDPWINSLLIEPEAVSPQAWITAANQAVAEQIAEAVGKLGVPTAVFAGGGVRNQTLFQRITETCAKAQPKMRVAPSDELGVPAQAREAMAWAVLGALSQDGIPISLPQVTGAERPGVAGSWAGLHPGVHAGGHPGLKS